MTDCPSPTGGWCAAATLEDTKPGTWSVVVAFEGCNAEQDTSFAVWAKVDGTLAPLTNQEQDQTAVTWREHSAWTSSTLRATLNLAEPATTDLHGCDVGDLAADLAGAAAVDCGVVPAWGDRTATDACAVSAVEGGKPFRALYEYAGMGAGSATALAGTGAGLYVLTAVARDGRDPPVMDLDQTFCPRPRIERGGGGGDVPTCHVLPSDGSCFCTDDGCTGTMCCPEPEGSPPP